MSLLDLPQAGKIDAFNEARGERAKVELFAADLAGKVLRGVDLSGADVEKADLSKADLTEASLYKTRMSGIDGSEAVFADVLGMRIKLRDAWLERADLTGADLSNGDLTGAVLNGSKGEGLRLNGARLKGVEARSAVWPRSDLGGARLSSADFRDADLRGADMSEAVGGQLVAAGARLDGVIARGARFPHGDFRGANLAGADLTGADLYHADFTGADLSNCNFTDAHLDMACLEGATLTGAVFADADLGSLRFEGLDLTGVDLTGLDPDYLGLDDAQRAAVVAVGVEPGGPLRPRRGPVAASGHHIAGVWLNDDGDDRRSLRWFACTSAGEMRAGIVPISTHRLIATTCVGAPEGVWIFAFRHRRSGVGAEGFLVGQEGCGRLMFSVPLRYEPAVPPLAVLEDSQVRLYGINRDDQRLIVSGLQLQEGVYGLESVGRERVPTARAFLGQERPLLVCKGGSLQPACASGLGKPHRAPDGFPGKHATAAFDGERWLVVWVRPPAPKDPGAVMGAWLVNRGAPEPMAFNRSGAVLSLDLAAAADGLWLAWVELVGMGQTRVRLLRVGEDVRDLPVEDVDHVAFARSPEGGLTLVLTTDDERILAVTLAGETLGELRV